MSKVFLSVVIPSYDEIANLQKGVLDKVAHYLEKQEYNYEVIVVDDGSRDGSVEFVEKFAKDNSKFKVIKNSHSGKAGAVTKGVLASKGEYVLFSDMDQATPIEEVERLLPFFKQDFDIVIGSRSSARKGAPWTRILMARGMVILRTAIVGLKGITDTQCGFKMFRHDVALKLFKNVSDMHGGFHAVSGSSVTAGFDVELLYIAQKMGYRIKEVPVRWLYVETRRVSPVRDSIDGFMELLTIRRKALSGKYNHI